MFNLVSMWSPMGEETAVDMTDGRARFYQGDEHLEHDERLAQIIQPNSSGWPEAVEGAGSPRCAWALRVTRTPRPFGLRTIGMAEPSVSRPHDLR